MPRCASRRRRLRGGPPRGKLYIQSSLCNRRGHTLRVRADGTATFDLTAAGLHHAGREAQVRLEHLLRPRLRRDAGDGIPTLVRSEFDLVGGTLAHQPPVALIEGIDAIRVEFGIDDVSATGAAVDYTTAIDWVDPDLKTRATNRGDGIPDGDFVRCTTATPCTAAQLMNATAVSDLRARAQPRADHRLHGHQDLYRSAQHHRAGRSTTGSSATSIRRPCGCRTFPAGGSGHEPPFRCVASGAPRSWSA